MQPNGENVLDDCGWRIPGVVLMQVGLSESTSQEPSSLLGLGKKSGWLGYEFSGAFLSPFSRLVQGWLGMVPLLVSELRFEGKCRVLEGFKLQPEGLCLPERKFSTQPAERNLFFQSLNFDCEVHGLGFVETRKLVKYFTSQSVCSEEITWPW
ncbi:hypothetical protein TNCT_237941 [Trichonephila clavata]|uniref:Uncharacterized protein n=1 Tax=Trichonephila clavata TaxID=2740835 RepID=A0A8X6LWI0_TRICU|nr:hypothetical protein TNCT_237941 [Trichonephila clavata]